MDYSLPNRQGYLKLTSGQENASLLSATGCGAHWRIVDLWTDNGLPFWVDIRWSAGGAAGQRALVSVARASRVSIYARDVFVRASNLGDDVNEVRVSVADSESALPTQNVYEVTFDATQGAGEVEIEIPPYASSARVELSEPANAATALLRVYDGGSALRHELAVADQPFHGLRLGAARSITVEDGATGRVVFDLQL